MGVNKLGTIYMKKNQILLTILFALINFLTLWSQTVSIDTTKQSSKWFLEDTWAGDTILVEPSHPIGIRYIEIEKEIEKKIQVKNRDTLYLILTVSKVGVLTNIRIVGGHSKDAITETVKVLKSFKTWTPGTFAYYTKDNKELKFTDSSSILLTIETGK